MRGKILFSTILFLLLTAFSSYAQKLSVSSQLESAKESQTTVLLVVRDKENSAKALTEKVEKAAAKIKNTVIIEMDASDKANKAIVERYDLAQAPMPVMLLISDRGNSVGGMLEEHISTKSIVEAIPSPKFSEVTYLVEEGKAVIINVGNKKFASDRAANEMCNQAISELGDKASLISLDVNDKSEAELLKRLNVDSKLKDNYIVVINGQGIMVNRFTTTPTKDEIIAAANKHVHTESCGEDCNHHHH